MSDRTRDFKKSNRECNIHLRKLISAQKSHIRETILFAGSILNQICNSQTSRFVSVPGQNPGRSNRGDSMGLRLRGMMITVSSHGGEI